VALRFTQPTRRTFVSPSGGKADFDWPHSTNDPVVASIHPVENSYTFDSYSQLLASEGEWTGDGWGDRHSVEAVSESKKLRLGALFAVRLPLSY